MCYVFSSLILAIEEHREAVRCCGKAQKGCQEVEAEKGRGVKCWLATLFLLIMRKWCANFCHFLCHAFCSFILNIEERKEAVGMLKRAVLNEIEAGRVSLDVG